MSLIGCYEVSSARIDLHIKPLFLILINDSDDVIFRVPSKHVMS